VSKLWDITWRPHIRLTWNVSSRVGMNQLRSSQLEYSSKHDASLFVVLASLSWCCTPGSDCASHDDTDGRYGDNYCDVTFLHPSILYVENASIGSLWPLLELSAVCQLRYASLTRSHSNTLSHSVDSKSCDQITSKSRRKSNVVSVYLLDLYVFELVRWWSSRMSLLGDPFCW